MRRSLAFSPDGRRIVVRAPAGLDVVDLGGAATPVTIEARRLEDFAVLRDEVWVVDGGVVPSLRRVRFDGAAVGAPTPLSGLPGDGELIAAPGGAAVLWSAAPARMLVPAGDAVESTPIVGEAERIVPIAAARWLACGRGQVALREPTSERWRTGAVGAGTVVDGAILFDGHAAALVVDGADGAALQLVVLTMMRPVIQHRLTLSSVETIRIAPTRGHAVLRIGERRLVLVDLRFGRVVKEHVYPRPVFDLAIDDAAQHLAVRVGPGAHDVEHVAIRDLGGVAAAPAGDDGADDGADAGPDDGDRDRAAVAEPPRPAWPEPAPPEPAPAAAAPPTAPAFHLGVSLGGTAALAPRPAITPTTTAEALAVLDRYRDLVTALAGRAIARAWDEGRLTYPNEGTLPFRAEVESLLGRSDGGRATDELRAADAQVAASLAAVRAAETTTGDRVPPLGALAREHGLTPLGRHILLVVAGPALWGHLARLYGILANDEGRPLVDEMLISQILGPQVPALEIARELDRDAPLIKYGIVRAGDGRMRPFMSLTIEPVVLRLLRGVAGDGDLDGVTTVSPTATFEELLIPAAIKRRIADALATPSDEARLVVRGRAGAGRHTLLATLAAAAGRRLGVIDATPVVRDLRNRLDHLRQALKRAHLLGLLPCVDGLETLASDDLASRDAIRDTLRHHPGPLAIRLPWDAQPPLDAGYLAFDLPVLTIDQRLHAWRSILDGHDLYVRDPSELATRYSVGPGVMIRACARVAEATRGDAGERRDVASDLEAAVRQHLEGRLGTIATRVTRLATWSQVILPPEIQDSLLELIARIKHRRTVYDVWGFDRVISTARGVTALFQGGPGTGKTLVAGAIANELGMDLYRVDLSRIMSKWIGETEQNLAKLFDAAEDGQAIILFDEADSLFAKRTEVRTSVDRYANLEVNYLLQRLDSFEGIAILTTNFGTAIDQAFKRRLSFRLTFPFPDEETREQLWRAHLPPELPTSGTFDFAELARRFRMSGGYIRNATLRAAFLAAEEHTPLTQDHLERAIRAEFREIGKLADSGVLE